MQFNRLARLVLSFLVLGPAFCLAAEPAPPHSSYWRERASFFTTFAGKADIVMLGDSLTDGAEWAEIFPGKRIVNRGIDGDTTSGLLDRVDGVLAVHPSLVFVMVGINDFADKHRTVDAAFQDYKTLVSRLQQGGAKVVVQSTLPCHVAKGAWKACKTLMPKIQQLNAKLATLATGTTRFVSLQSLAAPDGTLQGDVTFDGIHLNARGYELWKAAIAALMP